MADSSDQISAAQRDLDQALAAAKTHVGSGTGEVSSAGNAAHAADWTPQLVTKLSLGIAIFAMIALLLATVLMLKRRNAEQVLRTFGILVIIFSAIFLVIAGYSDTQITPVIGLLGTIAGYLLGRRIEEPMTGASKTPHRGDSETSNRPETHAPAK